MEHSTGHDAVAGGRPSLRPRATYLIAGGFLMLAIALGAYFLVRHMSTLSQRTSGQAMAGKFAAELLQEHLQGELLGITRTLGEENSAMQAAAAGQTDLDASEVMAVLDRVRQATRATIVYILNAQGDVVACTPYDGGQTLTGKNYAFRPYFKTAMKGRDVVYPAQGITTQKRGLYYSSPIIGTGQGGGDAAAIGVVVIKKGLEEVDTFFQSLDRPAALLTPEGVVFSGNRPGWLLHSFSASEEKKSDDRQFGAGGKLPETVVQAGGKPFQVFLDKRPYHLFISNLRLPSSEGTWRLVLLEDLSALLPAWFETAVLIASLTGLCTVAAGCISSIRRGSRPKLMVGNVFAAIAVAVMGSLFFLTVYVIAGQWETNRIASLFASKAAVTASFLSNGIKGYLSEFDTLAHFAASMPTLDQDRLGGFADPILARKLGLEAVFWAPRQGEEDLRSGRYVIALRQPPAARSFDPGFDLAADPRFVPAFRSMNDGTLGDVSLIPIKDENNQTRVRMAALAPVSAKGRADGPADSPPSGVIVSILDIAEMLDSIVSNLPLQGMYIRVTDFASEGEPLPLYDSGSPSLMGRVGRWWAPVKLEHRVAMAVADRYWEFVATGGAEYVDLHQNRYGPGILIVGGVLTLIAISYVVSSARRRQQVERLVENRTAQLAESESRVSAILESIQAGVVIVDVARKTIEYVNLAAAQMAGWYKEELQGKVCHFLICPNHKGRCPVADLGQTAENAERLLVRKDGSYVPIVKTVKPITFKGRDCYIETFVDITPLNKAQEALSRSEKNYRLLFESATDAVFLLHGDVISDANQTALDMFGVPQRDLLTGRHPADLSPPVQPCGTESHVLVQQHLQAALQQKSIRFDWRHKRQNGETFPTEVILKTLELSGRRVVQVVVRDISERKAHDDRLAETLQELERFNKVMLAREGRVLELKAEVNALLVKLGRKPEYRTSGVA